MITIWTLEYDSHRPIVRVLRSPRTGKWIILDVNSIMSVHRIHTTTTAPQKQMDKDVALREDEVKLDINYLNKVFRRRNDFFDIRDVKNDEGLYNVVKYFVWEKNPF